ncbi:MAG: hypothetical protein ABUS51_05545 [Acidobacteriota bacterium]
MITADFHLAILRSAAVLVPATQRADWLAEWRSELWHVRREPHGLNVTAFCMGAFRDAFWLWRDDPCPDRPSLFGESPGRCLWLLAALGAICVVAAFLLPAARAVLLCSLSPRNLVMLTAVQRGDAHTPNGFIEPYPSVSRLQFEVLKATAAGQFAGLAFYVPARLRVETPHGKRTLSVVRTTADLFRLLNIPVVRGATGTPALVLTRTAWRRYFSGTPQAAGHGVVSGVIADHLWKLPSNVDGWLIEDETALAALPAHTEGFAAGRLRYDSLSNGGFHFIRLRDRSFELFAVMLPFFPLACILRAFMTSDSPGGHPRSIGPRRGLFLAAKGALILPILVFGSLDLGSFGGSVSPGFFQAALFGSLFAARWIVADQRRRCPVCLRRMGNPVRIGEASRILLEWHGTEFMCPRGHGLLYMPEWPAIWSGRQRWMDLGASWGGLFR